MIASHSLTLGTLFLIRGFVVRFHQFLYWWLLLFVETLGLTNLAAPDAGVERFNSLLSLQSAVNKGDDVFELKATINGQGIDITAKNPTSDFEMTVDSFGMVI